MAGLFGIVRNPIYSGGLVAAVVFLLMVPNVLSAVACGLLLLGLQIEVRGVEEPYLTRVHRDTYLAYARTVGRFMPGMGHLS
jgi:protein-S-isoprenylcysteine O-methyltransferase Ste14